MTHEVESQIYISLQLGSYQMARGERGGRQETNCVSSVLLFGV